MNSVYPCIGLDIGGTLTKLVIKANKDFKINIDHSENLTSNYYQKSVISQGWAYYFISFPNSIESLEQRLQAVGLNKGVLKTIYITGGGAYKFNTQLSELAEVIKVNEFDSLSNGLAQLDQISLDNTFFAYNGSQQFIKLEQSIFPFLLVQIGSGVSILKFDKAGQFQRIGGTSLGGGMFLGLCHLFTGNNNFDQLLQMSKKGSNSKTDLLMDEMHIGLTSPVRRHKVESHVAVSLGKVSPIEPEDLVQSLLYMTAYNISQIAYMNSKLHNIERVFFSGSFIRNHKETLNCISEAFSYFSQMDGQLRVPYFIKHDGFVGALGVLQI